MTATADWYIVEEQARDAADGVSLTSDGRYVIGCEALYESSACGNTGKLDCGLCEVDDPDRYEYGGGVCNDCGEPPGVIGEVDCHDCDGQGYIPCDVYGNTG